MPLLPPGFKLDPCYDYPTPKPLDAYTKLTPSDIKTIEDCDRVVVDAEWFYREDRTSQYLTKQFTFTSGYHQRITVVLWHRDFALPKPRKIQKLTADVGHRIVVIPCDVDVTTVLDLGANLKEKMSVGMYYSPKDVQALVGDVHWKAACLGVDNNPPTVRKLRNHTGTVKAGYVTFRLDDHFGLYNSTLDAAFKATGLDNPFKDHYTKEQKGCMDVEMKANPYHFLEYAVGDTVYLDPLLLKRCDQLNAIIEEALGVPNMFNADLNVPNRLPRSSGSLDAKTFENWLIAKHTRLMRCVMQLSDTGDDKLWDKLRELKDRAWEEDLQPLNNTLRKQGYIHGLAMGSIRNYAMLSHGNTGVYGGVVQGGRCVCEEPKSNPYHRMTYNVIDPDLMSAYGECLRELDYPFGIPTLYERGADDTKMTLGEFIKRNNRELIPNLAVVYVSGRLNFDQDLIPSKYGLGTGDIMAKLTANRWAEDADFADWGREIEHAHIEGDFYHTTRQIELGVITHEVLYTLRGVLSNQEWSSFLQLTVDCAVYYPRSQELTVEQWCDHIEEGAAHGKFAAGDTRTRKWCRIPLSGFIGNFIDYRKRCKTSAKEARRAGNHEEAERLDLLQKSVKLFINTTYGCLAAPFFPMGNTVLANNITAKARVNVWMMSKALLLIQSITDGGMARWDKVAYLDVKGDRKKLPSMSTLSNRERLVGHRSVKVRPLTDEDVYTRMGGNGHVRTKEDEEWIDVSVLNHCNTFWGNYKVDISEGEWTSLQMSMRIEVKYHNTARVASYSNSDYLLWDCTGTTADGLSEHHTGETYLVKSRGAKGDDHPKKLWLMHLISDELSPVPEALYISERPLGLSAYQKSPGKYVEKGMLPGDQEKVETYHRPRVNDALCEDYAAVKKREDAERIADRRYKHILEEQPTKRFGLAQQCVEGKIKRDSKNAKRVANYLKARSNCYTAK
jgi:hypothetical protein